jgi:hypothetical protein
MGTNQNADRSFVDKEPLRERLVHCLPRATMMDLGPYGAEPYFVEFGICSLNPNGYRPGSSTSSPVTASAFNNADNVLSPNQKKRPASPEKLKN